MNNLDQEIAGHHISLKNTIDELQSMLASLKLHYKEVDVEELSCLLIAIPAQCGILAGLEAARHLVKMEKK